MKRVISDSYKAPPDAQTALGIDSDMHVTCLALGAQRVFAALAIAAGVAACSTRPDPSMPLSPLESVTALDVSRYAGSWYEIAKFPNWFQRACSSDTKAEYRPRSDGNLAVINRCRTKSGTVEEANGMARRESSAQPSQLEVTFVPPALTFLPFVWADYWVIDLDAGYQLVAVSEPRRKYLWILARTRSVDEKSYAALLARLRAKGFDVTRLELTMQSPGP